MRLGIYSASDPRCRSTWSGTSANLLSALEERLGPLPSYHARVAPEQGILARGLAKASPASALFSKIGARHWIDDLARHFHREGCDTVLHIPADHLPFPGRKVGLRHQVFIDSTFEQFLMPWFRHRYQHYSRVANALLELELQRRDRFYSDSLASVDHFFVTTDWVRQSLVNRYAIPSGRITTCYTGTGAVRNLATPRDLTRPKILFVARHNYINKGALLLLEAFRLIRDKHRGAELILVGPDREGLGCPESESRVTFHSFLEWQELERLFNSATLFAMPSLYEPYGLVYLEAMKCGTPVICSATGGMASVLRNQDCGWVLEKRQPQGLAGLLDEILSDPEKVTSKGLKGQLFVEAHCHWGQCAEKILKVNQIELSSSE